MRKDQGAILVHKASTNFKDLMFNASVEDLGDSKWRIHGVRLEKVTKAGFRLLDNRLEATDLFEFPHNIAGRCLLLPQTMRIFKEMVSGSLSLRDVPTGDASACHGDIRHLSLRQLLRMRALNLDYEPGDRNTAHTSFLSRLDFFIYERLGQRVVDRGANRFTLVSDTASLRRLGQDLLLAVALHKGVLSDPPCWVLWLGQHRLFFDAGSFAWTDVFSYGDLEGAGDMGGVLEVTDMSENGSFGRTFLDWRIQVVKEESELCPLSSRNSMKPASNQLTLPQLQKHTSSKEKQSPRLPHASPRSPALWRNETPGNAPLQWIHAPRTPRDSPRSSTRRPSH